MAGFLPFSAIYVELYYIFASVWGHKVYIIWSILLIVYIILIIVTAFITVALTYFQVGGLMWGLGAVGSTSMPAVAYSLSPLSSSSSLLLLLQRLSQ
jgi:hypothetical protein